MRPDLSEPGKHAGPSLRELVFQRLDVVTDRLMDMRDAGLSDREMVGEAKGLADALAIFTNPYQPNIDAIRVEAMERREARQAD